MYKINKNTFRHNHMNGPTIITSTLSKTSLFFFKPNPILKHIYLPYAYAFVEGYFLLNPLCDIFSLSIILNSSVRFHID